MKEIKLNRLFVFLSMFFLDYQRKPCRFCSMSKSNFIFNSNLNITVAENARKTTIEYLA